MFRPIPARSARSARCCANASSTSGAAPSCSRASRSHQLAEGHEPVKQSRPNRDPWEERLLAQYDTPLHKSALEIDLHMIRAYDEMLLRFERELLATTRQLVSRDYGLLNTVPGIGRSLALTILDEMDSVARFPTVKDFCSYCRLVKGSAASAGKLKGHRGAKLGNPYLRWAFGEAAVIGKRDHPLLRAYAQQLESTPVLAPNRTHPGTHPMGHLCPFG